MSLNHQMLMYFSMRLKARWIAKERERASDRMWKIEFDCSCVCYKLSKIVQVSVSDSVCASFSIYIYKYILF